MKTKIIFIISIILILTSCRIIRNEVNVIKKNDVKIGMTLIDSNYYNHFILDGNKGDLFIIDSCQNYNLVFVRWNNGYTSFGKMKDKIAISDWCVYDKNNRLRKHLKISIYGDWVMVLDKFNKRGKRIKEKIRIITDPAF